VALDHSALLEVLDALTAADVDGRIRQAAQTIYQALIEVQLTAMIGAAPHERTPDRLAQRNGHRARVLSTTAGDLELRIPKLRRRQASWPVPVAGIIPFIALRALDVVALAAVYSAVALAVLVWGAVDGRLRRSDPFRIQALGMLGFGAVALAGLVVDPDLGRYLVAAGWFGHGVWDFVHLELDKVVARPYALWCGILDIGIAAELVFRL
jgi:Transposase, Mutator family